MAKIIETKAVISATDQTGKAFDAVAKKIQGVEKAAAAFRDMKPFEKMGWGQNFQKEIDGLKLSARDLDAVNKSWSSLTGKAFDAVAKKIQGVEKAAAAFRDMKPFEKMGWGQNFQKEIDGLKLSARDLDAVNKSWSSLHSTLNSTPRTMASTVNAMGAWKRQTLTNLREVRAGMEEHEAAHHRFFKTVGGFVGSAVAGLGGAYLGYQGAHAAIKTTADRAREGARENFAGMSANESARASTIADELSAKYPSVGRTEIMAHVRQLRGRLGNFDHATDNVETLVQAQRVLQTITGGEGASEDLEKLVLGLESQGIGAQPEKFKTYMNAFVKAKSLFPDLSGEDFRQYMQAAKSSKYALSEDYLTNVVPTMMQHEGASKFGVEQASAFSALVGGRQTKAAKAAMASFGLMDKSGNVTALDKLISNPYEWATEKLQPALEKKGIEMTEENRGKVVESIAKMFSNRNVGEFFSSMLVNRPIIEKDRAMLQGAAGTEGALEATKDPYVALGALTTQLKDFSAALLGTQPVLQGMTSLARDLAENANLIREGKFLQLTGIAKDVADAIADPNREEKNWRSDREKELLFAEIDERSSGNGELGNLTRAHSRLKQLALRGGIQASENMMSIPPVMSEEEIAAEQERQREYQRSSAYHAITQAAPTIPLPQSRPAGLGTSEMPPAQTLEGARPIAELQGSAEVHGEVKQTLVIEPSSWFEAKMKQLDNVIQLMGTLQNAINANGAGSNGRTSPDAQPGAGGRGLSSMPY